MYTERSTTSKLTKDGITETVRYSLSADGYARISYHKLEARTQGIILQPPEQKVQLPPENAVKLLTEGGVIMTSEENLPGIITIDDFVHANIELDLPKLEMTENDIYNHRTIQEYSTVEGKRQFEFWVEKILSKEEKQGKSYDRNIIRGRELGTSKTWVAELKAYEVPTPREGLHTYMTDMTIIKIQPPHEMSAPEITYAEAINQIKIVTKKVPGAFFMNVIFQEEIQEPSITEINGHNIQQ